MMVLKSQCLIQSKVFMGSSLCCYMSVVPLWTQHVSVLHFSSHLICPICASVYLLPSVFLSLTQTVIDSTPLLQSEWKMKLKKSCRLQIQNNFSIIFCQSLGGFASSVEIVLSLATYSKKSSTPWVEEPAIAPEQHLCPSEGKVIHIFSRSSAGDKAPVLLWHFYIAQIKSQ